MIPAIDAKLSQPQNPKNKRDSCLTNKISSVAWRALVILGLLLVGMTSPDTNCEGLNHKIDYLRVLPKTRWLFPHRVEEYHQAPLEDLLICPAQEICLDQNEIEDQAERVRVVKLNLLQDLHSTVRDFYKFGIKSQSAIVKLAKISAKLDGLATSQWIQSFGIEQETDRVRVAKHCLLQNPASAENIQNFEIHSQAALIKLFEINYQNVGAEFFHKFKIKGQDIRTKLAELFANHDGYKTAKYFHNLRIKSEESRIKLAELCAKQNAHGTAKYFKNFAIHNEAAKVQLALLCALRDGSETLKHIQNFGIHNQSALNAIHQVCMQQILSTI
jgi:hypothetical protein